MSMKAGALERIQAKAALVERLASAMLRCASERRPIDTMALQVSLEGWGVVYPAGAGALLQAAIVSLHEEVQP